MVPDAAASRQAFFVAANTSVNLLDLPGGHFVRPFRVSQQLAAHGSTGDASACKLLLYKIRLIQSAHAGDGLSVYWRTSSQNFRKQPCPLKYGWLAGGMVSSRLEWFASVTWRLVTPASVSSGTKIPSSDSTTPALHSGDLPAGRPACSRWESPADGCGWL